jgi:hypothetical protein
MTKFIDRSVSSCKSLVLSSEYILGHFLEFVSVDLIMLSALILQIQVSLK